MHQGWAVAADRHMDGASARAPQRATPVVVVVLGGIEARLDQRVLVVWLSKVAMVIRTAPMGLPKQLVAEVVRAEQAPMRTITQVVGVELELRVQ